MQILLPNQSFAVFKKTMVYATLALWSLVCLVPLYWVAITAFKDVTIIDKAPTYIPFVDFTPSLDAWRFIFFDSNENLVSRAVNSVVVGACSTFATMLFGGMMVYGLTRFKEKSNGSALLSILLGTRILPPVVMALPLYILAQFTRTLDSVAMLTFVYTAINLPIAIWMLGPVLGKRATEPEEAAILDGASHFHIFLFILFPMVKTAVITIGLLVFLQCWNEFLFASYLTSDHALTLPPWMVGQLSMKEAQTGGGAEEVAHLAAATVFMAVPIVLLTIFAHGSFTNIFARKIN